MINWQNGITPINETNMNKLVQEDMITDVYSSSSTYAVGDYCIYENTLYKCTTAITTAETWNSAHWTAVSISYEFKRITNELSNKLNSNKVIQESGTASTSNVYSSKAVENLMNKLKKQIIWDGNVQVKTAIGNNVRLNNMPNLSNYIGKVINFYFSYGGDSLTKHSIMLTNASSNFFYTHIRNFNGSDLWLSELNFGNLKSTSWIIDTCISIIINNDKSMTVDNTYNDLRLYRIEVEP